MEGVEQANHIQSKISLQPDHVHESAMKDLSKQLTNEARLKFSCLP